MVYTVREVADILKVNKETVLRMINNHKLDAFKVGTVWRITEESLQKLKGGN